MTSTPCVEKPTAKPQDVHIENQAFDQPETGSYFVDSNNAPREVLTLHEYRLLPIVMAILSAIITILAFASCVIDIVICADISKYSGYDRRKAEKEANGGDQSMEGENFTRTIYSLCYALATLCAAYCLVVMLGCFSDALKRSHLILRSTCCCPSACLVVAVLIGVGLSILEAYIFFALPAEGLVQLGPLPVVRAALMLIYCFLLIWHACKYMDGHDYQSL